MHRKVLAAGAALLLAACPAAAQQKSIKIGFVSTFSGPTAVIGNDMRNAFELALDHMGRKMGGLPIEVIYEDDQQKPEVGKQKTEKLIESDKVDFIVGYIWSNVLLASVKPIADSKTILVVANAGASQVAGELCSPYFYSTSWTNEQNPRAVAEYMNKKGIKTVYLIGPNYAAGKENLAGLKEFFKGKVVGEDYTKWPDQLDFSAELSKARAANPDAIYTFYPGAAGIQFLNQYAQNGLQGKIPLYTTFVIDSLSLPRLRDNAVGVISALEWGADLPNDTNKKFVGDFETKFKTEPSFYAAQTYDAANLVASGVARVKGDLSNKVAVQAALKKADFRSVRGSFKFGNNNYPIQNFYMQEVVKDGTAYKLKTFAIAMENAIDANHTKCPMK
ncbi:ABC transporter substrate-binding protein [Microbacteriaceae bacterium K1510]|nr:ABC transporter substrate-binding protein [Microbacteriaceae bacterium K1510]